MKVDLKLIVILVAIVIVAMVGSAYITTWVFSGRMPGPAPVTVRADQVRSEYNPELVWSAGTFTVNLAGGPRNSYIKTGLSFRANNKETVKKLEREHLQVRDRVITTLMTTSPQELSDETGIKAFKERIINVINEMIIDDGGLIHEVYFSELIVQ